MHFYKIKKEKEFYTCDGQIISMDKYITIPEPTYDWTFKDLFSKTEYWKKNVMSLLNSLFVKEQIDTIEVVNNEFVNLNSKKNQHNVLLKMLKSDLSYKYRLKTNDNYDIINLVNIEMQLGYPVNFLGRLIEYGLSLRNSNQENLDLKSKTLVLGFINTKKKCKIESSAYSLSKFDFENGTFIQKIDNYIDIVIINLEEISQKLINEEKIYILGNEINKKGKEWLKLLSLRHWGIETKDHYYKIPNMNVDEDIKLAIEHLEEIKGKDISNLNKDHNDENKYYEELRNEIKNLPPEWILQIGLGVGDEATKDKLLEFAKDEFEETKLRYALDMYKKYDIKAEEIKKFEVIFKDDIEKKIDEFWGKDEPEKLKELKDFIGRKRNLKDKKID